VPKIAGSTSAQSLPAAWISRASSSAATGSGSALPCVPGQNRPPLKRGTGAARATQKPPESMVCQRLPTSGPKPGRLARHRSSSMLKLPGGSRPTLCANMQKIQRIKKVAT